MTRVADTETAATAFILDVMEGAVSANLKPGDARGEWLANVTLDDGTTCTALVYVGDNPLASDAMGGDFEVID